MVKLFAKSKVDTGVRFFEEDMRLIHCCGGKRKSKSFSLMPEKDYMLAQIDYLEECPVCGHTVAQVTRIDFKNNISVCRKVNDKARKFFEKLRNSIIAEQAVEIRGLKAYSKFYLNYNEFGVKKKCYSNLSSLKMGLFENKSLNTIENKLHTIPIMAKNAKKLSY